MTVVSIRCHECDEVKREKHIEMRRDGTNICDECKKSDRLREAEATVGEGDGPDEEEAQDVPEEPEEETEEEETKDNGSKFTEQDALSW